MEKTTNTALANYVNSLEITKVSFGKLFISDSEGNLAIEVTARGKNAFVNRGIFGRFKTTEAEILSLLKSKFPDKEIDSVFLEW